MLNQVVTVARSIRGNARKRLARARRRSLVSDMRRSMGVESLEGRLLLASNVMVGGIDNGLYVRTPLVGDDMGNVSYSPSADNAIIDQLMIIADLEAGRTVTIDTVNAVGSEPGDITIASDLSFNNAVNATLRLNADNHIGLIGATILPNDVNGTVEVILNSDRDQATVPGGQVLIDSPSLIDTRGGDITIGGGVDPTTGFALGDAANIVGVDLQGRIDSGAGNIVINGEGVSGLPLSDAKGVDLGNASVSSSTGTITIAGIGGDTSGDRNNGIRVFNSTVSTTSGNISLMGQGNGTGDFELGVILNNDASVVSQSGSVEVLGIAGASAGGNSEGIRLQAGVNEISSVTGSVTLTATSSPGGFAFSSGFGGIDVIGSPTTSAITINADSVFLDALGATSVRGSGDLLIQPIQPDTSIGLGDGGGTLQLNATELSSFDGFASITIGNDTTGSGAVTIDNATFTDPVAIYGGSISVDNGLSGDGGIELIALDAAGPGQNISINTGTVSDATAGVTIFAGDDFTLASGAAISAATLDVIVDPSATDADPGTGATALVNGTLNIATTTTITGGDDADAFSISPQSGSTFNVNGGDPISIPGDSLTIDGGGANATINAMTGEISVDGALPFTFTGIEEPNLINVGTLTLNGDSLNDTVTIASDPNVVGRDLLTYNGITIAISTISSLIVNGFGGNDLLTVDAQNGLPTTPVTFNGQGQDIVGAGDQITILGSFFNQTFIYTAPDVDDGNSGSIDLDGASITYTGLEPIFGGDSMNTILTFNTGLANDAILRDSVSPGTIELIDNGATFENTFFPNPTNSLTINLGDQGDTLNVATLDAAYAASMIINGGASADNVQFNTVTISNTPGRGLDVAGVETLGITDSTLNNNTADDGAGLRVFGGTTTIDNSTFMGNTATGDDPDQGGGAIFNDSAMTIQNGTIIDGNMATGISGSGGGIFLADLGSLTILDSTITNNSANRAGGGIESESGGSTLTLTNVSLQNNIAGVVANPGNGGGLHITGTRDVLITGSTISGNTAAAEGGGLWNDQGLMTINGGTIIDGNVAAGDLDPAGVNADLQGGGGIFNNGGSLTINDTGGSVTIQNNQASGPTFGSGGGILSTTGSVTITGAAISTNEAVRAGGGLEIVDGTVTITNSTLSGNDVSADDLLGAGLAASPGNGGGLHITGAANVTIEGGTVSDNVAEAEGGGLWNSATGTLTIDGLNNDVNITGNVARGDAAPGVGGASVQGGGGIFNNGGTLNLDGDVDSPPTIFITGNAATGSTNGSGGGILSIGGTVNVDATRISNNEAVRAGGGVEVVEGNIDFAASEISGNDASNIDLLGFGLAANPGNGGGLHVTGGATVLLSLTDVTSNRAQREGGGLWNNTGTMTIANGSTVDSNTASGDALDDGGGGIFNNGGTLNVLGISTSIDNNLANGVNGSGGGIMSITGGTVSVTDATISGNTASIDGGGIVAFGVGGNVTLLRTTLTANVAGDSGGGMLVNGSTTVITDSNFNNNRAQGLAGLDGVGGGLFIGGDLGGGDFTLTNTNFNTNTALGGGGGAEFVDADGTITGGTFGGNTVNGNGVTFDTGGGAIAIVGNTRGTTVDITGVTINANTSPTAAGIGIVDSQVVITDSTISNNSATDPLAGAGGIGALVQNPAFVVGNLLEVFTSTISGNITAGEAGGIGVIDGDLLVVDTTIDSNTANGGRGGGIGVLNATAPGSATVRSSTISANTASVNGGGIAVLNSGLDLENVTIFGNNATSAGGGIAYDNSLPAVSRRISFSTISSNTSDAGGSNISAIGSPIDVVGTIFDNGVCAALGGVINSLGGNLDSGDTCGFTQPSDLVNTDPLLGALQDNNGPVFTLALLSGSPAIDAAGAAGPAVDARGIARPQDGNGDASLLFDIGAFEAESTQALFIDDVTVNEDEGFATIAVRLPTAVAGGFTVDFTTADGTAIQPDDYASAAGTLTFAGTANEVQTFTVTIVADTVVEPSETVLLSLANSSNAAVDITDTGLLFIDNDDTATLTVFDVTVDEGAGTATVTVAADNAVQGGFTVDFTTSDGTAIQPDDYTTAAGTLSFLGTAGESQTFVVTIIDDTTIESTETINVSLLNPSVIAVDASDTAVINITDNESPITVDAGDSTLSFVEDDPSQDIDLATLVTVTGSATAPTFSITTPAARGTTSLNGSILTYTPDADDFTTTSLTVVYTATADTASDTGTISIDIAAVNDRPVAVDDVITGQAFQPLQFNIAALLGNDSPGATNETADVLTILDESGNPVDGDTIVTDAGGSVSFNGSLVTYTRPQKFFGNDSFQYSLIDSGGLVSSTNALVTIALVDAATLAAELLGDPRVTISNATLTGGSGGAGFFAEGASEGLPIDRGIILSSGFITDALGPNDVGSTTGNLGAPGDADLASLLTQNGTTPQTFDASILEFDFQVPVASRLSFEYLFASEEYNEFVGSSFNDVFGFFMDSVNIATVPGTNIAVAINNVNNLSNSSFYNDNSASSFQTQFDGFTTILEANTDVLVPGQVYHLKLGVADVADSSFDSAVFLRGGSFGIGESDLTVVGSQLSDMIPISGSNTYTFVVNNNGPDTATNTSFVSTLPLGATVDSATSTLGTVTTSNSAVSVNIGDLAPGQQATVVIEVTAPDVDTLLTTHASISGSEFDPVFANNAARLTTIVGNPGGITGVISCDDNGNGVVDSTELKSGVTVFIDANNNGNLDPNEQSTLTDVNGVYVLSGVAGMNRNVTVLSPSTCNTIPNNPGVIRSTIPVGVLARAIAHADTDLDGDQDLIIASDFSSSLTFLENGPNGFADPDYIPLDLRPFQRVRPHSVSAYQPDPMTTPLVSVAAIGTPTDNGAVYTLEGTNLIDTVLGSDGPIDALVDDLNADGLPDRLSASFRQSLLELRLGGSSETIIVDSGSSQILNIASGQLVESTATREFVVSGFGYGDARTQLEVYGFDEAGGVVLVDTVTTVPKIVEVSVESVISGPSGEFRDEIVALYSSGRISVFPLSGNEIGTRVDTPVSAGATAFDFGDFNNDGITDVAVANLGQQIIEVFTGTGDGRFALITTISNVSAPSDLTIADFNGDGFDDIAVANFYVDANINNPNLAPDLSVPSTVTILRLDIASKLVNVPDTGTINEDFTFPTANAQILLDVSGNGLVSGGDALRVINALSRETIGEGERTASRVRAATDVNGDGRTSAVDALMIINYLHDMDRAEGAELGFVDSIADDDDDDRDELTAAIDLVLAENRF